MGKKRKPPKTKKRRQSDSSDKSSSTSLQELESEIMTDTSDHDRTPTDLPSETNSGHLTENNVNEKSVEEEKDDSKKTKATIAEKNDNDSEEKKDEQIADEGGSFFSRAAEEYDELFKRMQIWCRLEAEKHLMEAEWFERKCLHLDLTAKCLGALSFTSVATFMLNWIPGGDDTAAIWTRLGFIGFVLFLIAVVLEFVGKGSADILPTFQKRADEHRKAAFSWQHIKHDIRPIRIKLRDPEFDVRKVATEYTDCVERRMKVSGGILVSSKQTNDKNRKEDRDRVIKYELQFLHKWPVGKVKRSADNRRTKAARKSVLDGADDIFDAMSSDGDKSNNRETYPNNMASADTEIIDNYDNIESML